MRLFLISLIAGIALVGNGCAVTPTAAPESHAVRDALAAASDYDRAPAPRELGPRPQAITVEADGTAYMAFDHAGALRLSRRMDNGERNTDLARELGDAINAMREERSALAALCLAAEDQANTSAARWAQCDSERRNAEAQRTYERALEALVIVLLAVVAL